MSKKWMLRTALLAVLIVMAGCVDLFAVPGIALSPDGNSIVFLSGQASLDDSAEGDNSAFDLARADLGTGETTVLAAGSDELLITAFAVSPANGDVAYVSTTEDGVSSVMVIGADGSSRELVGASTFPGAAVGTMMKFSPDGSKLAFTVIQLPPGMTLDSIEDSDTPDPALLAQIQFVAYVVDVASGQATAISSPEGERANTLAWSPSGDKIAYNAWYDGNDDGIISTMPSLDFTASGASDSSRISVYNVGSGTSTPVDDPGMNYSPVFLNNDVLAFVSADPMAMGGGGASLKTVDLNSGAVNVAYTPAGGESLLGVAVSPDGSQVAWVESSSETTSGDTESEVPSGVFVSGTDFASPTKIADLPTDMLLPDVPIWTPDGSAVLVSVTNILSTLPAQISMSFSMDSSDPESGEATAEVSEAGTIGKVVRIDVASGEVTEVFNGAMINSSFFSSLFSLAASGDSASMFGAAGQ